MHPMLHTNGRMFFFFQQHGGWVCLPFVLKPRYHDVEGMCGRYVRTLAFPQIDLEDEEVIHERFG